MIISSTDLQRFYNNGEVEVSQEVDFLFDRVSLSIVPNQAEYVLPDGVKSITRVTWLGMKLDPIPGHNFRDVFESGEQFGKPFWYRYNNMTVQNQISLFPIPQVTILPVTNVWGSDIINGIIVEFCRISDNQNFILPSYARNSMLRRYVQRMATTVEGPNQNLKKAQLYAARWELQKKRFKKHADWLRSNPRKLIVGQMIMNTNFPASPILPIDQFGISVDPGE